MHRKANIAPYVFIAPFFIIFILFSLLPILFTFYISFTQWNGFKNMEFIGIANYVRMIQNGEFVLALKNTVLILAYLLPVQLVLGLIIAYLVQSKLVAHKGVFRTLIFAPYFVIPVAAGLLWGFFLDRDAGIVNDVLKTLHIIKEPIPWVKDPVLAKISISITMLWRYTGYTAVMFMAGLVAIPESLYEAARVDGAKPWHNFWYIALPLLKPISLYLVVTSIIGGLQTFDEPQMIFTQGVSDLYGPYTGGPERTGLTMVMLLFKGAFSQFQYGYGAAVAYGMFLVISIFSFLCIKIMTGGEQDELLR